MFLSHKQWIIKKSDKTETNNDCVFDKTERNKLADFDKTERNSVSLYKTKVDLEIHFNKVIAYYPIFF